VGEEPRRDTSRRLSVGEAADELGVSVDALRSRVKRGTIPYTKHGGRVWILLGEGQANRPVDDQSETNTLISEMRARIEFLEEEHKRKDAILLNMTEAMKALSPPPEENPPAHEQETSTAAERRKALTAALQAPCPNCLVRQAQPQ